MNKLILPLISIFCFVSIMSLECAEITEEQRKQILAGVPAEKVLTSEQLAAMRAGVSSTWSSGGAREPRVVFEIPLKTYLIEIGKLSKKLQAFYDESNYRETELRNVIEPKNVHWRGIDRGLLRNGLDPSIEDFKDIEKLSYLLNVRLHLLKSQSASVQTNAARSIYDQLLLDNSTRIELILCNSVWFKGSEDAKTQRGQSE